MKLAERMDRILIESAFVFLVRARALEATGRNVIHLEIGEPDFPTPAHIVEAAKSALDQGWTHYGPTQGYPELREAVAAHVSATRGIAVGPQHVSIVPGGKPIIFFPMLALLEPGDEVIYPDPGFPIYQSMIQFLGATPVPIPLIESRGFSFDLDLLRDRLSSKTRMLVLNSPQNPTGGVIPADEIEIIADLVRERDLIVLSDEIYSRIYYGNPPASIASLPGMLDKTIILDGFSKTYAMTGWRLGYGVMPEWLVEAVSKLMVNSNSCTAGFQDRRRLPAERSRCGLPQRGCLRPVWRGIYPVQLREFIREPDGGGEAHRVRAGHGRSVTIVAPQPPASAGASPKEATNAVRARTARTISR
jgi:aspartate aminotransferase